MINEYFLVCYFMHFDPISSRIYGVFQPYFWSDFGEILGVIFVYLNHTYSLMLFATFLLILSVLSSKEHKTV